MGFQGKELPPPPADADPFLADLCERCLSHDPAARPTFPEIVQVRKGGWGGGWGVAEGVGAWGAWVDKGG